MKKILLLTVLGAMSASQLMAVDLYMTGSTAFRKQVYNACLNLFSSPPSIQWDTTKIIGGDGSTTNSNPVWTMSGNAAAAITALSGSSLVIHGNFTGSVQGMDAVENKLPIVYLTTSGTLMTNTPTISYSDVSSTSTPFPVSGNYKEEKVAVQPFVIVKSHTTSTSMNSITNISWDQLKSLINLGSLPLSVWSGNKTADYGTPIYLVNRTQDSGTRRTVLAETGFGYAANITIYNYDVTNQLWFQPSGNGFSTAGSTNFAVVGGFPGFNNVNCNFGPGYIGGSDVGTVMKITDAQNLSLAYLSLSDAKSLTGVNWSQVIALEGLWPTAAGSGLINNTGTNDFTPVCAGFYPYWAYEVCVYPNVDPSSLSSDQNLTHAQLGTQTTAGTLLGVLDKVSGTPGPGSIDNEIQTSKTGGATAIRIADMTSSRTSVGGGISP